MDPKTMYEASWQHQRQREAENVHRTGWTVKLRHAFTRDRYQVVVDMMSTSSIRGGALIDIGCGRGEILRAAAARFDRLVGVDISDVELQMLGRELPLEISVKTTLCAIDLNSRWPFADGEFEVVSALSVVEHLFDPYFISAEMARICRPGGYVLVEVPNIAYLKYRMSLLTGVFPITSGDPVGWDGGHIHYFTLQSMTDLFRKAKCEPVLIKCAGFLHRVRNVWPSMLGPDLAILFRKSR
jgi:2-polyprenyl-3-methyl-5-hydroxy-6-metoxy-1,4-benzoquinol methylase